MIYWHVTDRPWDGGDLVCRDDQDDPAPWKWDDAPEGFDTEVVCLFGDVAEAREFRSLFAPGGSLLRVELEHIIGRTVWDGDVERRIVHVREGYDAIVGRISAKAISMLDS